MNTLKATTVKQEQALFDIDIFDCESDPYYWLGQVVGAIDTKPDFNMAPAARWIAVCEACNILAKWECDGFYVGKVVCAIKALEEGAIGGWGDDDTFSLFHKGIGTISLHDPFNDLYRALPSQYKDLKWSYPWSRVYRQDKALDTLCCPKLRKRFALMTHPRVAQKGLLYQDAFKRRLP